MPEELTIRLDEEAREAFEQAIFRRIRHAVMGASDRDALLVEYDDQVEGLSNPTGPPRWNDACDLDAPLTREACLTVQAQLVQAIKRDPKVVVEAVDPDDDDNAQAQEALLSSKSAEIGLDKALAAVAYYAIKYPVGVLFADWTERLKRETYPLYKDGERYIEEHEKEPGKTYDTQWFSMPVVEYAGPEVRAVPTGDFYLYPANARSLCEAGGCGERMLLTADDLLRGISDYGYDREAVYELIERGPGSALDQGFDKRGVDDQRSGVSEVTESGDGVYECFLWYTHCPLLRDASGEFILPEEYLTEEFSCVACPDQQVMLRLNFYRKPRPYIPFYIFPRYEMFYGDCIPQILNALQTEANANLRFFIDSLNITMSPAMKVKMGVEQYNENFRMFPGAMVRVQNMDDMEPFQWAPPPHDAMQVQGYLEQAARELYSSSTFGQMPQKSRKNAEVQAVQQAAMSKFDLILFNFQQGLPDLAARLIALYLDNVGEEGLEFMDETEHRKRITPQALKGRYIYKAIGTSQSANPDTRLEHALAKQKVATDYALFGVKGLPPALLKRLWYAARNVLIDMGEHNPEGYLGPEPQEMPAGLGMLGGMGGPQGMMAAGPMTNGAAVPASNAAAVPASMGGGAGGTTGP